MIFCKREERLFRKESKWNDMNFSNDHSLFIFIEDPYQVNDTRKLG